MRMPRHTVQLHGMKQHGDRLVEPSGAPQHEPEPDVPARIQRLELDAALCFLHRLVKSTRHPCEITGVSRMGVCRVGTKVEGLLEVSRCAHLIPFVGHLPPAKGDVGLDQTGGKLDCAGGSSSCRRICCWPIDTALIAHERADIGQARVRCRVLGVEGQRVLELHGSLLHGNGLSLPHQEAAPEKSPSQWEAGGQAQRHLVVRCR